MSEKCDTIKIKIKSLLTQMKLIKNESKLN